MESRRLEIVCEGLKQARKIIQEIEKLRESTCIAFYQIGTEINAFTAYKFNKLLRRMEKRKLLDLIIESGGGDLDAAAKISKLLKKYFDKYTAIVPFYAKSAATYLALRADTLILCKAGELGPIDPQVKHPTADIWIPAHSIKEAIEFIEETKDPLVKLSMADKLDPLLMGAYRDVEKATQQYVQEVFEGLEEEKKNIALHSFTGRYRSHGYPIDDNVCKSVGIKLECIDENLEKKIYDLHEEYLEIFRELKLKGLSIIQSSQMFDVEVNGKDITRTLEEKFPELTSKQGKEKRERKVEKKDK